MSKGVEYNQLKKTSFFKILSMFQFKTLRARLKF